MKQEENVIQSWFGVLSLWSDPIGNIIEAKEVMGQNLEKGGIVAAGEPMNTCS